MAGDLIRFVDSIVASPTVRLDLNDETSWWVKKLSAPPPRLRRSQSSNAMRDGVHVSSANYDARTITLELENRKSTQDLAATEIQKLWRELDRANNYLMYQPTGATKPVFFKLYRSDSSQLDDVIAQAAMRTITIELLAEPFALGLKETLGPYTVNNDPAAGSNPTYFDVTGVIGDVAALPVIVNTTANRGWGMLSTLIAGGVPTVQAEGASGAYVTASTVNPGGGPDAVMSGTTANNYLRTTFSTTTLLARLMNIPVNQRGCFHVMAVVRRSDATSVINVGFAPQIAGLVPTTTVPIPLSTSRQIIDLGVHSTNGPPARSGYGTSVDHQYVNLLTIFAARASGTATLDWDCIILVPATESTLFRKEIVTGATLTSVDEVIDSVNEHDGYITDAADPFSTANLMVIGNEAAGSFPKLAPNVTTRFYWLTATNSNPPLVCDKTTSDVLTVYYWPRYLFVRPSAT